METSRTPGAAVWPDKMITRAEAFAKAADWPVSAHWPMLPDGSFDKDTIILRCEAADCRRGMGQLRRSGTVYNGSLDEMLAMVLRHMVQAHDTALNTRGMQDNGASGGSTHG
jgi:hypothetical protein